MEDKTYAQQVILEMIEKKKPTQIFQDHWTEYSESYGSDYNDCHGDYYDSE